MHSLRNALCQFSRLLSRCPFLSATAAIEEAEDAIVDALVKAGPTPRQQFILIRWAQKAAGALVGVATAAFLLFYQWVIEPAAPGSLRVKAWARLTNVRRGLALWWELLVM